MAKQGIHFEVSERKILLRIMDMLMVLLGLYLLEQWFGFEYLLLRQENGVAIIELLSYLTIFGTVFEIYDLQKSSKLDVSFRDIVLASSTVVLFYFLTRFVTPLLPEKRLQIIHFYIMIIVAIFLWRIAYATLISSPRFYKKVLLVGEVANVESIVSALNASDPNYKIIGFINCEEPSEEPIKYKGLKEFEPNQLIQIIEEQQISEVLVASYNSETITPDIYHDLMTLLEKGFTIREYTQVYEEITNRVPIQFVGKDFYKYFPFSRSNQNTLYLFFHRVFDVFFSLFGLLFGLLILPFVMIGNALGNQGPLFYSQERVGK